MMKHTAGSDLLSYNLYIDRNYTRIWGDGSGNTYTRSRNVGRRRPWLSTIYGRIPPGQDVSVGTYGETLTVIITW
jgi:spore coat protein U-like protein